MLAEKVAAGTLPKVEDRMPKEEDILVSDTYESTGVYGGDFNYTWMGVDDKWSAGMLTEEPLFRFLPDGSSRTWRKAMKSTKMPLSTSSTSARG